MARFVSVGYYYEIHSRLDGRLIRLSREEPCELDDISDAEDIVILRGRPDRCTEVHDEEAPSPMEEAVEEAPAESTVELHSVTVVTEGEEEAEPVEVTAVPVSQLTGVPEIDAALEAGPPFVCPYTAKEYNHGFYFKRWALEHRPIEDE